MCVTKNPAEGADLLDFPRYAIISRVRHRVRFATVSRGARRESPTIVGAAEDAYANAEDDQTRSAIYRMDGIERHMELRQLYNRLSRL